MFNYQRVWNLLWTLFFLFFFNLMNIWFCWWISSWKYVMTCEWLPKSDEWWWMFVYDLWFMISKSSGVSTFLSFVLWGLMRVVNILAVRPEHCITLLDWRASSLFEHGFVMRTRSCWVLFGSFGFHPTVSLLLAAHRLANVCAGWSSVLCLRSHLTFWWQQWVVPSGNVWEISSDTEFSGPTYPTPLYCIKLKLLRDRFNGYWML